MRRACSRCANILRHIRFSYPVSVLLAGSVVDFLHHRAPLVAGRAWAKARYRDKCIIRPQSIVLMGHVVGTVARICPKSLCMGPASPISCVFMRVDPSPKSGCDHGNIMTPSLISIPQWLRQEVDIFKNQSYLGFYSQHSTPTGHDERVGANRTLGLFVIDDLVGSWSDVSHLLKVDAKSVACDSVHGPDVQVDSVNRRLVMYVHGHGCLMTSGRRTAKQPTFKLESTDGLFWQPSRQTQHDESSQHTSLPLVLGDLFYTRYFSMNDNVFIFAKSQEDPLGYLTVVCSKSLSITNQQRVRLLKGVRHFSIHRVLDVLFIFFTLITDSPERIMLGTIDLTKPCLEWAIFPGPIILQPELHYEHGGVAVSPSKAGSAGCKVKHELRDPFFFAKDTTESVLSGWLLYVVKGEGGIALSKVELDLLTYLPMVDPYFSRHIPQEIINASSLATNSFSDHSLKKALVTGTGRSGTTFVCKLFNRVNLSISHDNDVDCGTFPGVYGSSSWYHAFRGPLTGSKYEKVSFEKVVHVVRNPLKSIHSRATRTFPNGINFMKNVIADWESTSELAVGPDTISFHDVSAWALKHWVRRNSFVSQYASWRVRVEDFVEDPWHSWALCVAMGLGSNCPLIEQWRHAVVTVPEDTNTGGRTDNAKRQSDTTWEKLATRDEESHDHVRMALKLAKDFGYVIQDSLLERYDVDAAEYKCKFTEDTNQTWACRLDKNDESL